MIRPALAAALFALPLWCACGGGAAAEPPPCDPIPPAPAISDAGAPRESAYAATLYAGLARIANARADFRRAWPRSEPVESGAFRGEAASYTATLSCTAAALKAVPPPGPGFGDFKRAFDAAMDRQGEIATAGRDAVRQRNVSRYEEFTQADSQMQPLIRSAFDYFPR